MEPIDLTHRSDLERVADGEPRCKPFRLSDRVDLRRIRGQDDGEETSPADITRPGDGEGDQ